MLEDSEAVSHEVQFGIACVAVRVTPDAVTLTVTVPELSILLPLACTIFVTPTTSAAGTLNGTPTVS